MLPMEISTTIKNYPAKEIMKNRRKDLEGNTINWLLVKSFQYKKDHPRVVFYRYNCGDEYKAIRISERGRYASATVVQYAYDNKIPNSQAKYHDLRKLCNQMVIPADVHK